MLKISSSEQAKREEIERVNVREKQLHFQQNELARYRQWLANFQSKQDDDEMRFAESSDDTDEDNPVDTQLDEEALRQEEEERERQELKQDADKKRKKRHDKKMGTRRTKSKYLY
jgi:hypothetical protein